MAERRTARSGTGGRANTRRRPPADRDDRDDRDDQEMLEAEPEAFEEDEDLESEESGDADDEMLDEPEADEMAEADESPANGHRRSARRGRKGMTAGQAAQAALREIAALTAKQPEGITGVQRTEDGWMVGIELVEDQRIPSSSDILATYETTIDADGELTSYRRVRRYARGRGDTGDA